MFFDRHNQKNSSEKEASGDITCTSCFGTIIAAAAIAVVRDREPQGLVVQPVLWDLLVQEGVPV